MIKQPILSDLNFFIKSVSQLYRIKSKEISPQLIRTSLNLLEVLPAARDVVFECFSIIFDISIENYLINLEKNHLNPNQDDDSIADILEAIENLITKGSSSWAPLISSWSLILLGKIAEKHNSRRHFDVAAACNFWLGCDTIRCLLHIAATCFDKLSSEEMKMYIKRLLTIFVKSSPFFDWVVANIGSCFPLKIISELLHCGLQKFSANPNSNLESEISVLGYLAQLHEKEMKCAVVQMMESSINPAKKRDNESVNSNSIPYMIHLCRMSDILLQPIVSVFLEIFDDSVIPNLSHQSKFWSQNYNTRDLLALLTDLSTKLSQNGTKILLRLSTIAGKYVWCYELLEYVFNELEKLYLMGRSCPLLHDVLRDESKHMLWKSCCSENPIEHTTAVRLILLVASARDSLIYRQTICELLKSSSSSNYASLGCLVRILGGPSGTLEIPEVAPGLELALEMFFMQEKRKQHEYDVICYNILKNLVYIVRVEKKNTCPNLKRLPMSKSCEQCIAKILTIFENLLEREARDLETAVAYTNSKASETNGNLEKKIKVETGDEEGMIDDEADEYHNVNLIQQQIHSLVQLIDILELTNFYDVSNILKLSQLCVKYFFWSLTETNPVTRLTAMNRVFTILERQSQNKAGRAAGLIDLLEGALFKYSNLFGGVNILPNHDRKVKSNEMLITVNQKLGSTTNTNRTILHAGIIGKGLREPSLESKLPAPEVQTFFLKALTACCNDEKYANVIVGYNTISLLLVEMVSPDVMYNGLPWLEEEFTKVTMERDLQIRRTFKNSQILWTILQHVATYRPALCFTSVLFRALCASVLHQWQAKSVEKTANLLNSDLMFVTKRLLEIMALGQFIPQPLSYFYCVIEYFDPTEIAVILKECIWNYMKENVPSPLPFQRDANGFQWREIPRNRTRIKDDILRNMMERKLAQLGHYYYMMFVLPDSYELPPLIQQSNDELMIIEKPNV